MTTLSIDVPASRGVVSRLDAVVAAVDEAHRDVVAVGVTAGFGDEHSGALTVIDEMSNEVGLTAQVLGLAADQTEAADATYAGMLAGWLSSSVDALRTGLNDTGGASVRSMIAAFAGGVTPPWAADLAPGAADAWLATLPEPQRISIAAAAADRFDGTAIGDAVERWMATLEGEPLREIYVERALLHAGIDMSQWNPELGLPHNAATVEAVYEYYVSLYRGDTDELWWAGMAALIGPSFYGGFQDLETFRSLFEVVDAAASSPLGPFLPPGVQVPAMNGDLAAAELLWYQTRLLTMQREIFIDMAAAHEAYLDGGVSTMERFYVGDTYGFEQESVDAWRMIEQGGRLGDTDMIAAGNAVLLRREQQEVIADDYDLMRERPYTGEVVTWAMTLVGAPSVPGTRSFPEVFPLVVDVDTTIGTPERVPLIPILGPWSPSLPVPHAGVSVGVDVITPFPDGNISRFDDRWALIQQDTLPTYVELARDHPEVVLDVLDTPIGERAESFTIDERIDDIIERAA